MLVLERIKKTVCFLLFVSMVGVVQAKGNEKDGASLFAVVDGMEISKDVYYFALNAAAKKRYFHGRLTEERLAELSGEVQARLINNALVTREAERMAVPVDQVRIKQELAQFEERYREDASFQENKNTILASLQKQLESRLRIELLEERVKSKVSVTDAEKKLFYQQNAKMFELPAQQNVSLILLKVLPNARKEDWDATEMRLMAFREEIEQGGVLFSDVAKRYSDDETALKGGRMEFLHEGMLHEEIESALTRLSVGEMTMPIRVLEGFALLRLDERNPARLMAYDEVLDRITLAAKKKKVDAVWQSYLAELKQKAEVWVNPEFLVQMTR